MQQVEFPSIPNTKPDQYQSVTQGLLGYIKREKPDDRELRKYMRARSIFDKLDVDRLFDLIGIKAPKGKTAKLTKGGAKLAAIDDNLQWQKAIFDLLASRNEILVKYVFDALAERLYSVNEIYRVITSYVYPGEAIRLPDFKNWMSWIEATEMIKYIGIRWGLSKQAKEIEVYLRTIDVEELLEDELEGGEEEEVAEAADEEAEKAPLAAAEGDSEDEALPPDLPPEPDIPDVPDTPADSGAPAEATGPAQTGAKPLVTYRSVLTLRSVAEIQEIQRVLELDPAGAELAQQSSAIDDAELAQNLDGIQRLWETATDQSMLGFESFGIVPKDFRKRTKNRPVKGFFLYRALLAASCAYRPTAATGTGTGPTPTSIDRFKTLDESGALTRHFIEGQPLDEVVAALVASAHGARLDILSLVPYMALARQALIDETEVGKLAKEKFAEAFWESAYERLHAGVFSLELIWVAREMFRHQLWKLAELEGYGVVPTPEVMDIAFRIGLLPSPYLGNFASVLYASRTLTGFSNAKLGLEAGLLHFGKTMGCAYDCPNRRNCSYYCREKLRR
jgi:hypothetical protein